jgi:hypothetical protein
MAYPRFRKARAHKLLTRTSGDITANSTTWANLDTGLDMTVPASIGDTIRYGMSAYVNGEAVALAVQPATLVSGALVSWFGGGEPTTTTGTGVSGWFVEASVTGRIGPPVMLVVVAGDISSGKVTVRLRYRTGSASAKTVQASTTTPLQVWMENIGPVSPH